MGWGNPWWVWVHISATVRCFEMLPESPYGKGVFNLTAPEWVTQARFASALRRQLIRPAFMPLPEFVVKLVMAEFGEEVLWNRQRVFAKKLLNGGSTFNHGTLSGAQRHLL
jgi:NAD dependent epimerase/dehydratase family enzyme